jgi:L-threonylcarbamoyladenylate synthase
MPTETVYGLAADASNPEAVAAIFAAKGRPSNHPLIVHVARDADLSRWACEVPDAAKKLIVAFWPGPLTLILKRASQVPAAVTGGQESVGLRCPAHPVAQALLKEFKAGQGGLAAPSANRFGRVSPTTAQHVMDEFGATGDGPVAAVLDGGPCEVGIESTIVDLTRLDTAGPALLRPGRISAEQLEQVLGVSVALPDKAAPRVSGSLDAHYAPQTPVALIAASALPRIEQALKTKGRRIVILRCVADADVYAQALYAKLRALDHEGAELILVEQPPQDLAWQGVNDRLRRAAFDSEGIVDRLLA